VETVKLPAFADVHVHLREPGFEYKETIATGTAAAAAGGFADVCSMPNLKPVPDALESLRPQLEAIASTAVVRVHPIGAITVGENGKTLADMEGMAPFVCGFSDDGHGVQDAGLMREAMLRAKALGKTISAHCEVNSLLASGGCIHDGQWARDNGFTGISSASEWKMVERDLELVRDTRCRYHVCHVSTKESVALVRDAKADGLPVSCETGPHYLVMADDDLRDEGRFKMNPPIRSAADREALREGLADGTVDCVATDHAPHSAEEKGRGLRGSAFGIVGLETSFPILYTCLVEKGLLTLDRLVDAMAMRPREIFGLPRPHQGKDFVEVELGCCQVIDASSFMSKGRATPFDGWEVHARILRTVCDGRMVFEAARPTRRSALPEGKQ
jgi:dihydroorotase